MKIDCRPNIELPLTTAPIGRKPRLSFRFRVTPGRYLFPLRYFYKTVGVSEPIRFQPRLDVTCCLGFHMHPLPPVLNEIANI